MEVYIVQYHVFADVFEDLRTTDLGNRTFRYTASSRGSENCFKYITNHNIGFDLGFCNPLGCYNLSTSIEPEMLIYLRTLEHSEPVFEIDIGLNREGYLIPLKIVETSSLSNTIPFDLRPYLLMSGGKVELLLINVEKVPISKLNESIDSKLVAKELKQFRSDTRGASLSLFDTRSN